MVLAILFFLVVGAVLIYGWLKLVNAIFSPFEKKDEDNPYIKAHRVKMQNDKMYNEYLKWLDKNGGDIPFEKWKTREEKKFDKKIKDATFDRWRPKN